MSTTEQPDSALVAHNELDIPGRTGPVSDGPPPVWGINRAAALDNFPQQGLLCRAGPWGQMNAGDKVNIYWGDGQLVLPKTVQEHEVNTELQMFIASKHFEPGTYAVYYNITRLNQAPEPSEVMQVQVKLTRPGGHDDTEEPGHPHLLMSIPKEILEGGVHSENVEKGVEITIGEGNGAPPYPNAALGDRMRITWGGVFVNSDALSQEQAEGNAPIVITVTEAIIKEAGDADFPGLAVAFEVYDKVFNRSEDWSPEQRVVVAVDATRLDAPLLKEARNNELDLDALAGKPGTAQVQATAPTFKLGDIIIVQVRGTPIEGAPVDFQVPSKPLDNLPSIVELDLPNAVLMQLAKTTFSLSCRVEKADGTADLRSKSQFIRAIGEVQRLAAPIMLDEESGALDPTLPQIRLQIPFDKSFVEGQVLRIFMLGTTPELKPYLPDLPLRPITHNDIVAAEPLLYNIDGKHLAPVNGGTAEFYYQQLIADAALATLDPFEASRATRESIHTQTLQVGEPRLELPQPLVAGVVDGVLPADTAGTTLTVPYKETVVGDEVFMFWTGSITGEYPDSIKLNEFTAGQEVTFTIPAAMIKGNEGGTVIARYEIKRADGRTSYAEPLRFSVGVALENPLPAPQMPEASGTGDNVTLDPLSVQNGARVVVAYTGMDETHTIKLSMHGTPGAGSPDIAAKPGVATGSIEFLIPATAIAANIGNSAKTFTLEYEVTGQQISSIPLTVSVTPLPATELDKISIEQAEGTVLDLTKVTAGATFVAGVWAFIAVNQRVKLRITGTKTNGDPLDLDVWPWASSHVNQNWVNTGRYAYTLAYNAIKDLAHDSRLELHFKAALTSSQVEGEAIDAPVKAYTVKAYEIVVPTLTSIKGSPSGAEIPNNGSTFETAIILGGTATPYSKIDLVNYGGLIPNTEIEVDPKGDWTFALTSLVAGTTYNLRAKRKDGPVSNARNVSVVASVVPTLSNVWDASNVEVPDGATTVSTELKLKGTASLGQQINVRDGTGSGSATRGTATANGTTGIWELPITVPTGARRLYAEACYPSNPLYSNVRNLTVTEDVAPTITSVKGSPSGDEIPQGGTTVETAVTLSGIAAKGQTIQVLDDAAIKGEAIADRSTGVWALLISALTAVPHSFTAEALYGSGAVSAARTMTVTAATAPTLTSVKGSPSGVEIPENGYTAETAITISGFAANGLTVEVFDNDVSKGQATANASGAWERIITGLSTTTAHTVHAKGLYGPGASTGKRGFTVLPVSFTEGFEKYPSQKISTLETTYMIITSQPVHEGYVSIVSIGNPHLYLVSKNNNTARATLNLKVPCSRIEFTYSVSRDDDPGAMFIATFYGNGSTPLKILRIPAYVTSAPISVVVIESNIRRIELSHLTGGIGNFISVDNLMFTAQT